MVTPPTWFRPVPGASGTCVEYRPDWMDTRNHACEGERTKTAIEPLRAQRDGSRMFRVGDNEPVTHSIRRKSL